MEAYLAKQTTVTELNFGFIHKDDEHERVIYCVLHYSPERKTFRLIHRDVAIHTSLLSMFGQGEHSLADFCQVLQSAPLYWTWSPHIPNPYNWGVNAKSGPMESELNKRINQLNYSSVRLPLIVAKRLNGESNYVEPVRIYVEPVRIYGEDE